MLLSGLSFSLMGTCTQLAGRAVSWQTTALARCAIPIVLIGAWTVLTGGRLVLWGPPALWWRSLAGSFSLVGSFYALNRLPLTDVYTISNLFPVWVALLSWPLLGTFPGLSVWLSVASGVLGVAVIMRPSFAEGQYAVLVVVGVSLSTALALMGLHRLAHLDPRAVVVHFSATALVFAVAAALLFDPGEPSDLLKVHHVGFLFGAGLFAAAGQYFLTRAFAAGDPARLSVVGLTQIVFVLAVDALVLRNRILPEKLLGIPLILGPTAWLMLRSARRPSAARLASSARPALEGETSARAGGNADAPPGPFAENF